MVEILQQSGKMSQIWRRSLRLVTLPRLNHIWITRYIIFIGTVRDLEVVFVSRRRYALCMRRDELILSVCVENRRCCCYQHDLTSISVWECAWRHATHYDLGCVTSVHVSLHHRTLYIPAGGLISRKFIRFEKLFEKLFTQKVLGDSENKISRIDTFVRTFLRTILTL